jgi:hypothetical protein
MADSNKDFHARRRHHYVPQCYLKRFADKKENLIVDDIMKLRGTRRFRINIENFLLERGLYDLSPIRKWREGRNPQRNYSTKDGFTESLMLASIMEPLFEKYMREYFDQNKLPPIQYASGVANSLLLLMIRNPRAKIYTQCMLEEFPEAFKEPQRELFKCFGMNVAKIHMNTFAVLFKKVYIHIYNATGKNRFITTDYPVCPCILDLEKRQFNHLTDFENGKSLYHLHVALFAREEWPAEVCLLCPISPTKCLLIQESVEDSKYVDENVDDNFVSSINNFMSNGATRYVIIPPDFPFQ